MDSITQMMLAAAALIGAIAGLLKMLLPLGRKLDEVKSSLDGMSALLTHEWETNGKKGIRDTVTEILERLDAMSERLARGDTRFGDIETGMREGAERGEAILERLAGLERQQEGYWKATSALSESLQAVIDGKPQPRGVRPSRARKAITGGEDVEP